MQVSTRSYLTAGLSFLAAGALIATPMSPPAPKQEPSRPVVRDQQVKLAALTAPITVHNVANNPAAVHVLAEVSRAFQSAKIANATSAVGATAASPSVARTKAAQPAAAAAIPSQAKVAQTGAVTTQDPETADTPDATGGQSLTPRSAAVNALDTAGVANILASAAQLALDSYVTVPARVIEFTAYNVSTFLGDVAALNPHAISHFLLNEGDSFQRFGDVAADIISGDVNQLQNAINGVFGVNHADESVAVAKTVTKPDATATSPVSGAVDNTAANEQQGLDPGSKGAVTGKHSQDGSAKPAKVNAPRQKGDTAPAKQSGNEIKDHSTSNTTDDATKSDAAKGDTTKGDTTPNGQSTSTSTSNKHNAASSTVNDATKDKGASKTKSSTHTASHTAGPGKHSATKGGHSGHSGHGGHAGHGGK